MTKTIDRPVIGDILLNGATAVGAGNPVTGRSAKKTFDATLSGTGTISATVIIEGSNTGAGWTTMGQIDLSNSTKLSDGFYFEAPWTIVRARVSAISGTGAAVNCAMGS